jgi:glutathione S-transferase
MTDSSSAGRPRLFYSEGSPYARICRMALRERGLAQAVDEAVTTLRDPAAAVLPYNPVGRVPALALPDGTTLTETTLILGWLDGHGGRPGMMPASASGQAAYGRVLGLLDGVAVWNRELRRPASERSPSVIALELGRANRVADALESQAAQGAFSTVDAGFLALAAVLGYAERRHTVWKWREGRPFLDQWFAQASGRAAFCETLPPPSGI